MLPEPPCPRVPRSLSLLALLTGSALAQVETAPAASTCPAPRYILQVDSGRDRTPVKIALNDQGIDLSKTSQSVKKDVTPLLAGQNRIQINWEVKERYSSGGMFGLPMSLKVLHGSRATTLVKFDPKDYPNQRQFAYKFSAPPKGNIACDRNAYTAELGFSQSFGPFEWTISVDGKYYAYVLGDDKVDLRPFLKKGPNKLTLSWRVIGGNGTNNLANNKVAQVTSTVNGKTSNLLTFGFKNVVGSTGSKTITINVP